MIQRLPPELLGFILSLTLPAPIALDIRALSSDLSIEETLLLQLDDIRLVCRLWDNIATSTPSLWTTVFCHDHVHAPGNALEIFRRFMQRSGSLPVDVSILFRDLMISRSSISSGFPTFELSSEANEVKRLLNANAHRIRALAWEGRGAILWPLATTWSALQSMALNFHFSPFPVAQLDHIPSLRRLQIDSADGSHLALQPSNKGADIWQNVDLTQVQELDFVTCPRNSVIEFLKRCPNVTTVSTSSASASRKLAVLEPLKKLQRLKLESNMDWLPSLVRPHATTLMHLSLVGQLVDLPIWVSLPVLPALRTLEVEWQDGIEPLLTILEGTPSLQALHVEPKRSVRRVAPLFSYLSGAPMLLLPRPERGDDENEDRTTMPVPTLRLLRLYFDPPRDEAQPDLDDDTDIIREKLHLSAMAQLPSILESRPNLMLEILLPRRLPEDRVEQVKKVYESCTTKFGPRVSFSMLNTSPHARRPLADCFKVSEDPVVSDLDSR